ncbi:hypothetical protein [Burkholderia ubonensis]|uniref:hypothetical protein n=1 Tax=Burkholderia ubonensis TaxID=101571 RepID=UPI0012FA00F5|nr:hypothetical protein [Burkholderia ubonensis]
MAPLRVVILKRKPSVKSWTIGVLFGMSTAFIFAVIQADFRAITEALHRDRRRG